MAPRQKHAMAMGASGPQAKYTQLDFNTLNIQVLRKYRQAFKLTVKARSSKDELVMAASHHYAEHTVDEVDTIARFLYTVHSNKEKCAAGGDPRL